MTERRYRALLIGNAVFRRDPQGLPRLQGPRADVDALCEALADPQSGLFAPEDIEPLIDRNVQSLREELYRFFIEEATRDDVLLLYYSGHGKLDLQGRLHLCASDTRVGSLPVTALKYKEDIEALVKESPASSAVTVLDCCHSGAFRGGELKVKATGKGRCVITSASATELALDTIGPGGTSPFTSALVTGLRFARAEGRLTAQVLYDYLETELSSAGNSRPQFFFDGEGAIPLARRYPQGPPSSAPEPSTPQQPDRRPESDPTEQHPMAGELPESPGADGEEDEPSWLTLPEPRSHLWSLLNEAAASSLSAGGEQASVHRLREVIDVSVGLDARWSRAVFKRLADGGEKQAFVEATAAGLAKRDPHRAFDFASEFTEGSPEHTGAHLAIASALPESEPELALRSLQTAINHSTSHYGEREVLLALRILEIHSYACGREPGEADAALARVARDLMEWDPRVWTDAVAELHAFLKQDRVPASEPTFHTEVALRLATFDPGSALDFFVLEGRFLQERSLTQVAIPVIVRGAGAMLGFDPPTGHRLLEIAERRCHTTADWTALYSALHELLRASPGPAPAIAGHLVTAVERAVDQVPQDEYWQLRVTPDHLVATAPAAAGRLLRLDPDEDRARAGLISLARKAAAVDAVAARSIATAAERLVLSILDETEQADKIASLAEAFAAIDPDHALRLVRAIPETSYRQAGAIRRVANVFTRSFPDRIEPLAVEFTSHDERRVFDVYSGIAEVDPARAVGLVASMADSRDKQAIIALAARNLMLSEPDQASEIALGLSDTAERAHTLHSLVSRIAASDPDRAAVLARKIPTDAKCAFDRATALCSASRALSPHRPDQAEYLLSLAERSADLMDDGPLKGSVICNIAHSYIKSGLVSFRVSQLLAAAERLVPAEAAGGNMLIGKTRLEIMVAWAAIAPTQAERIASESRESSRSRDFYLRSAAIAMAPADPRRAEQFAFKISDQWERLQTIAVLVGELCESAPARAERLALAMEPGEHRTRALLAVAEALQRRRSGA